MKSVGGQELLNRVDGIQCVTGRTSDQLADARVYTTEGRNIFWLATASDYNKFGRFPPPDAERSCIGRMSQQTLSVKISDHATR
jgi:hypothetical protein